MTRKATYFIADLHLGANYITDRLAHERRVTDFLDSIKPKARSLFLLGDVMDYWFEYKTVAPRGYVRFLGKLAELADDGVEVVWFLGNHDMWLFDYLKNEIGMEVVDGYQVRVIDGKKFFISHGDGIGKIRKGFRFIRTLFRNRLCQKLLASIHPRWTVGFAHAWSAHSRGTGSPAHFRGNDEPQIVFAREYLLDHPDIDFFMFGHRHILKDFPIQNTKSLPNGSSRVIMLGDCFKQFSYAVFEDGKMLLSAF